MSKSAFELGFARFGREWAVRIDAALRKAVEENCCPSCGAGTHPEAMVVKQSHDPLQPAVQIGCIRCMESGR